jgi:signal transduction histidine kinase
MYSGDPEDAVRYLGTMHKASKHLLNVVNSLLDFSKLEAKRVELDLTELDLHSLVEETVDPLKRIAETKSTQLIVLASEGDCQIRADAVRIAQVIVNLVGNAIKFSDGQGAVTIGVRAEADACVISVSDQGIGIAGADQQRIFESFSQVDSSNTRRFGGTGLGLSITKRLVELHAGQIWLESELGRGSTFHVRLPRHGPRSSAAMPVGLSSITESRLALAEARSEAR